MTLEKRMGPATRDAYGEALVEIGKTHPEVVVLDADLSSSTRTSKFAKAYPDRFYNFGIAEANMVGAAGGLAASGLVPFASSFACFLICKTYDQLRMAVAFPELDVKIVTSHGGISVGEDGASQQSIEDVALACSLPNFAVMVPSDAVQTKGLIHACASRKGPVYVRTGRPNAPVLYEEGETFEIGKAKVLRSGKDVTIVANGLLVWEAMVAAETLATKGVAASVLDLHTIKPLDEDALREHAARTGAVVVAEEHQIWGGAGSAVARFLAGAQPVPMEFVAIEDTYAETGTPEELFRKYGLTAERIVEKAQKAISRKG